MTSCVHGFHVYQDVWTPFIGEVLNCRREEDNRHDRYAVAVYKSAEVVGHVPRTSSHTCSSFLRRGGIMKCIVIGSRRYSRDTDKGGMEIPCKYIFKGLPKEVEKVQKFFEGALKTEVQVNSSADDDDHNCNAAQELTVSAPVSVTTNTSMLPEKRALDLADAMKCCSVDKRFKPDDFESMPSSSTSLSDSIQLGKQDEAVKLSEGGTLGTPTIDLTAADVTVNTKQVWVQFRRNTLNMVDKCLVADGSRLTDKHIKFASCLISRQFPRIGGLRTTLLQTRYYCFPPESIQALFCKSREHWIVASNILTSDNNTVNVYDSLFTELDQESTDLILRIFQNRNNKNKAVTIVVKTLQKQKGSRDCGLFAIAVMASLAHSEDPCSVTYDQSKMRKHLLECFSSKLIMPFPKSAVPS